MNVIDREHTLQFLSQHVKTEVLMKHLFAVEAVIPIGALKHSREASAEQ